MLITVRTAGAIKPNRPLSPLEVADMLRDHIGKTFTVDVSPTLTGQGLADMVDGLLGMNPADTFDEVILEHNLPLDNSKPLGEQGVAEGDELFYRFFIKMV
jgi:hypothetical protein